MSAQSSKPGQHSRSWRLNSVSFAACATYLVVAGVKLFRISFPGYRYGAAKPSFLFVVDVNAAIGRVRGQLACLWYSLNFAIGRVEFPYILYGRGEAGVRAWEGRGWGRTLPLTCGGLCRLSYRKVHPE